MQAQPAVRAEHADAFGKVVERLALDADQRVVAAFQVEPLGDVLVYPRRTTLRMRAGNDAQRLAVRHVPPLLARLGRAIRGEEIGAPRAEVGLLGQFPRGAQTVEDCRLVRCRFEEAGIELEQGAIGSVVGPQATVGAENRNRGLQSIERARVEVDLAAQRCLRRLDLGNVDGDAGAAALRDDIGDVEDAARAGDNRRQALGEHRTVGVRRDDRGAAVGVEQFEIVRDGFGRYPSLPPPRHMRRWSRSTRPYCRAARSASAPKRAWRASFPSRRRVGCDALDFGAGEAFAGQVAEARDRRAAHGAAAHLDQSVATCRHNLLEMLAFFSQEN